MTYKYYVMERNDIKKIDKLNKLTNKETFWDDVNKLTKNVTSDYSIHRWQCLAECRFNELLTGCEDVKTKYDCIFENGKLTSKFTTKYYSWETGEEIFVQ